MQSITALAHLNCAILFMVDVSGAGQYSIREQV
jgi:GTP1/Obg family GTP-binding protein